MEEAALRIVIATLRKLQFTKKNESPGVGAFFNFFVIIDFLFLRGVLVLSSNI